MAKFYPEESQVKGRKRKGKKKEKKEVEREEKRERKERKEKDKKDKKKENIQKNGKPPVYRIKDKDKDKADNSSKKNYKKRRSRKSNSGSSSDEKEKLKKPESNLSSLPPSGSSTRPVVRRSDDIQEYPSTEEEKVATIRRTPKIRRKPPSPPPDPPEDPLEILETIQTESSPPPNRPISPFVATIDEVDAFDTQLRIDEPDDNRADDRTISSIVECNEFEVSADIHRSNSESEDETVIEANNNSFKKIDRQLIAEGHDPDAVKQRLEQLANELVITEDELPPSFYGASFSVPIQRKQYQLETLTDTDSISTVTDLDDAETLVRSLTGVSLVLKYFHSVKSDSIDIICLAIRFDT